MGVGVNLLFLPPQCLLLPLLLCPLRFTASSRNQRGNAAADLLHAGINARQRPTPSSTMPPPLLSTTLLGDWIFLCVLAAVTSLPHKLR
jgi:hypothetical protein